MAREFAIIRSFRRWRSIRSSRRSLRTCGACGAKLSSSGAKGARREMVAAAVSRTNACPYCVEIHSAMLRVTRDHDLARKLQTDAGAAEAVRREPLIRWAFSTREPRAEVLAHPPFV
jgi:AhpD family alkylhydroperoxidase